MGLGFIPGHSFEFSVLKQSASTGWVRSRPEVNQRASKMMAPGIRSMP
jgi:hypothetical protein